MKYHEIIHNNNGKLFIKTDQGRYLIRLYPKGKEDLTSHYNIFACIDLFYDYNKSFPKTIIIVKNIENQILGIACLPENEKYVGYEVTHG